LGKPPGGIGWVRLAKIVERHSLGSFGQNRRVVFWVRLVKIVGGHRSVRLAKIIEWQFGWVSAQVTHLSPAGMRGTKSRRSEPNGPGPRAMSTAHLWRMPNYASSA
jgi:hypothetical protein